MYICFFTFIGIIIIIYTTKYISGMCLSVRLPPALAKKNREAISSFFHYFGRQLSPPLLSKEQYSWSFFLLLCSSCQHSVSGLLRYVLGRYCLLLLMLVQYYISFFLLLFLLQSVSTDKYYTDNTTISYRYNTIKNKEDNRT